MKILPVVSIQGDDFSPSALKEKCPSLTYCQDDDLTHEPMVIGKVGRYRGVPIPYGTATIKVSDTPSNWEALEDLVSMITSSIDEIRKFNCEVTLHCDIFYDSQCNFQIDASMLKKLAFLGIDFSISCWDECDE